MATDHDQASVEADAAGMPAAGWPDLTVPEIVDEIVAYLPNPGHFQQQISAARVEEGYETVELTTLSGQIFRLRIEEVPA